MSWFVESLFAPVLEPEESQKEEGGEERKGKGEEEKRKIKEKARKEEVVEEEEREVEQERKEETAGNEDDDEDDLITDIDSMVSAIKSPPPPKSASVSKVAALAKQLALDCEDLLPPPPGFGGGGADKKAPTTGKVTPYIAQPPSFTGYHAELLQSALVSVCILSKRNQHFFCLFHFLFSELSHLLFVFSCLVSETAVCSNGRGSLRLPRVLASTEHQHRHPRGV